MSKKGGDVTTKEIDEVSISGVEDDSLLSSNTSLQLLWSTLRVASSQSERILSDFRSISSGTERRGGLWSRR
jgi:hypothetical protein